MSEFKPKVKDKSKANPFQPHPIHWTPDRVKNLWDYYSDHLQDNQYFSYHSGQYLLAELGKHIHLNGRILDYGCGPGYLIKYLTRLPTINSVYGVDFSKQSVNECNRRFKGWYNFKGAVAICDYGLPFKAESFDNLILVEVIEHLEDAQIDTLLREAGRVVRPGGRIVLTTPHNENLEMNQTICPECGCIYHRWQHVRIWDTGSLRKYLARDGFQIERVEACHFQSYKGRMFSSVKAVLKRLIGRQKPSCPHLMGIIRKEF